ncbi:MAG: hypothetical protein HYY05_07050 [Chloroflexi bacterium]|nr:hypothetical protein [Chloroflexota bacterium]
MAIVLGAAGAALLSLSGTQAPDLSAALDGSVAAAAPANGEAPALVYEELAVVPPLEPLPTATATPVPTPTPVPPPRAADGKGARLFLANLFPWYESTIWEANLTAERPKEPYSHDDPNTVARQVRQAREAGIDGFVSAWLLPGDRTDRNLTRGLQAAEYTSFRLSISFLGNALAGQNHESLVELLRYILRTHGSHPNFLRYDGKPVIFFNNMNRLPTASGRNCAGNRECIETWKSLRQQVEAEYPAIWIGEGLNPAYLEAFDGIYVIKVTHRDFPNDYQKSPFWGRQVRHWASLLSAPKVWVATVMPGWDDVPSSKEAQNAADLREPSPPFRVNRADGAFYRRTFQTALESSPDWILLNSFNEWVEGSQIEASEREGDLYLRLTSELAESFKRGPEAAARP